jgi:hypothetical protein
MTKTEAKLIDLAKQYGGTFSIETGYGLGPKGGKVRYGVRERNAVFRMVAQGIVQIVDRQPWDECNRGNHMGGNVIVFKLVGAA